MPLATFYTPHLTVGSITLDQDQTHHARVIRLKLGDTATFLNGMGTIAKAHLTQLHKNYSTWQVATVEEIPPLPACQLLCPLLQKSHLERAITQAIELGVTHICFYRPQRCTAKAHLPHNSTLLRHAIAACKQSGNPYLPILTSVAKLTEASVHPHLYYADFGMPPLTTTPHRPATVVVGAESGYTEEERTWLQAHGQGINLGPWTLRAITAIPAALTLLQSHLYRK